MLRIGAKTYRIKALMTRRTTSTKRCHTQRNATLGLKKDKKVRSNLNPQNRQKSYASYLRKAHAMTWSTISAQLKPWSLILPYIDSRVSVTNQSLNLLDTQIKGQVHSKTSQNLRNKWSCLATNVTKSCLKNERETNLWASLAHHQLWANGHIRSMNKRYKTLEGRM